MTRIGVKHLEYLMTQIGAKNLEYLLTQIGAKHLEKLCFGHISEARGYRRWCQGRIMKLITMLREFV